MRPLPNLQMRHWLLAVGNHQDDRHDYKTNGKSHSANAWLDAIEVDDDDGVDRWRSREEEGKRTAQVSSRVETSTKSPVPPLPIDTSNYPATQPSTSAHPLVYHSMHMQWQSAAYADKHKKNPTS